LASFAVIKGTKKGLNRKERKGRKENLNRAFAGRSNHPWPVQNSPIFPISAAQKQL
jgi:hypothetical protein